MAINKESNGFTFGFAIALVVIVGSALAILATALREPIAKNGEDKKRLDILSAFVDLNAEKITRKNAKAEFDKRVLMDESIVLDAEGNVQDGVNPFDVDIRKEYKDKTLDPSKRSYPLFVAEKDGKKVYVAPIVGKGLWGPIWGNICIDSDMKTIVGASFGHKGETPGLGAEIAQKFFVDRWIGEPISDEEGNALPFKIVKDGSGKDPQKVDGISGGTITSKGVEEMVNRCMEPYVKYFNSLKK